MERLWGEVVPVARGERPRPRWRRARPDGFRWAYTPGHAIHHVAYLHEDDGHRLHRRRRGRAHRRRPGASADAAARHRPRGLAPLDRPVAAWEPSALAITHFGTFRDVTPHLESLHAELDRWARVARRTDAAGFESEIRAALATGPEERSYLKAMPPDTLYGGLARYWQKRDTASSK